MRESTPHVAEQSGDGALPPPGAARASTALVLAGLGWVAAASLGAGVEDGSTRFYVAESVWLLAQTALLVGFVGLRGMHPHGRSRAGGLGLAVMVVGGAVFVLAEAVALATGETQDVLLPVAAVLTALGAVAAGVAVLRAGRWTGWRRGVLLGVGLVPFVVMFPFAATSDGPSPLALAAWGTSFAVLGAAARREATGTPG